MVQYLTVSKTKMNQNLLAVYMLYYCVVLINKTFTRKLNRTDTFSQKYSFYVKFKPEEHWIT